MNQLLSQTLAQIVTADHRTASVFQKYHLDFCCKGKRSLQTACEEQHISADELLNELSTAAESNYMPTFPFDKLPLFDLTDYILSAHHAYVKKEAPQISAYLQKVASKHGQRHPELLKIFELFTIVKEEMETHMQKEELVLFPRINELEKTQFTGDIAYVQKPVDMMEQEHEYAGSLMAEIRQLTNNYTPPPDACTTYKLAFAALEAFEADLHQHVHLENNILFPKAIALAQTFSHN